MERYVNNEGVQGFNINQDEIIFLLLLVLIYIKVSIWLHMFDTCQAQAMCHGLIILDSFPMCKEPSLVRSEVDFCHNKILVNKESVHMLLPPLSFGYYGMCRLLDTSDCPYGLGSIHGFFIRSICTYMQVDIRCQTYGIYIMISFVQMVSLVVLPSRVTSTHNIPIVSLTVVTAMGRLECECQ